MHPLDLHREKLLCSLLEFTKQFYYFRTGKKFLISEPIGRESHFYTITRALTRVIQGKSKRLIIQIAPRYGKSEFVMNFIAWYMAQYPDSQFMYISYSFGLAKRATKTIRRIMTLNEYRDLFGIEIPTDSNSQWNFETQYGGSVYAAGAGGEITGRGAGIFGVNRPGGAIIIDDIHKPEEVHSDTVRQGVLNWYDETLISRLNDPKNTPIIVIGQSLHEDDLPENLKRLGTWETVVLPSLDGAGNALYPEKHTAEMLRELQRTKPYFFFSQHQQTPIPSGGSVFNPDWFVKLEDEPDNIVCTFLTIDTAETSKDYNDATVFSFWGMYKVKQEGIEIDMWALHWLDCIEMRIEPYQLQDEFNRFYTKCCRHPKQPRLVAIEKKSTGVTLLSALKQVRGLNLLDIERTAASGNKTQRFLEIQSFVSEKYISVPEYAKHTKLVLDHMSKITANDTHAHDDICDTLYDAVKIALIDKLLINQSISYNTVDHNKIAKQVMGNFSKHINLRNSLNARR